MEQYPITIDGEDAGTLTIEQQGARTVFTAECAMRPELLRISVYGGGREGYLGVLAPEGGALRLRKELSRSALREFPEEIEQVPADPPRHAAVPEPEPELVPDPGPAPDPEPPPETDGESLSWYASPDGALVCYDGAHTLIALPMGDERIPPDVHGENRTVEGREYLVYRTKNGRIVK